ncbi:alanyl (membrane) aminopeptidase-like b [Rhinichthys klamathensis goyatoka]|uniref:alanyl (membrane) aminopeptidase-like b n=1 Tax=Rhinichthys klamathensis goyatoka TaxID=3034132 RepID=UPI0024B5EB37|nr:alanyl (membrane) aminopeptidase-like b [Rhinichthys klamathensis goyatoka]
MAKGTGISKAVAVGIGVLTVSSVCGLVLMVVMFQIEIEKKPPIEPPRPTKPPVIPTDLPTNLRLYDYLIPESYKVVLQPYLYGAITNNYTNQSFFFTGNSTVTFKCMKDSKTILLHVHNLNVTNVEVRKSDSNEILESRYTIHYNVSNFLEIQLEDKLSGNGTYDLFTNFEGELFEDLTGLYVSRYTEKSKDEDEEDEERFLATSLLQPTDARRVFPCFDEPALKAVFEIIIIHRPGITALSNKDGVPVTIEIDGEEWVVTTFPKTPVMSTYLLAFTLSDFTSKSVPFGSNMHIYARREAIAAGHADYAAEITHEILIHYEKEFGFKYPLDKLDQIALPDFSGGAMENWGLISYQESGLLYDRVTGSTFDKERVATQIAHELAHQWFGNLVTMRWWNDLWLNEAFATYMSYIGVEAAKWDLKDLIVLREIQSAFQVDSLNSSHPLSLYENDIQTFSEIIELFDDVTYSKGAAVLRMLSSFMTEIAFMRGVKMYLNNFQYNNTVYSDLLECLQKETNLDLEGFMSTWIEQVGYPVITIITQTGETSQEQFLLKPGVGHNIPWQVQITYIKSDDPGLKKDLLKVNGPVRRPHFQLKDQWVLANINCTGFYRVNYDEENWNKLQMQLEKNHHIIPLINRGQLIDDAFNLARAHRLDVNIPLNLTKFLVNDTEYIPWESALKNLDHFILMFDRSEVYGAITKYLRKQITGLYEHFEGYTNNGTIPEDYTDQHNQVNAISVACTHGLPDCIEMATSLFMDYKNGTNLIHPNLRRAIYCSAIAAGDEDDWEFVWEEYQRTTVAAEKDKLRYALSCTKEIWLLNRYLEYTLDPSKIRNMDMVSTINYIAKNVAGQPLAWDFVRGKWSYITQEYGAGIISLGSLLDGVTKRFSRDVELEELKQLQRDQDKNDQGFAARALEQVIERTEANIKWVNENKQNVKDWFNGQL